MWVQFVANATISPSGPIPPAAALPSLNSEAGELSVGYSKSICSPTLSSDSAATRSRGCPCTMAGTTGGGSAGGVAVGLAAGVGCGAAARGSSPSSSPSRGMPAPIAIPIATPTEV